MNKENVKANYLVKLEKDIQLLIYDIGLWLIKVFLNVKNSINTLFL